MLTGKEFTKEQEERVRQIIREEIANDWKDLRLFWPPERVGTSRPKTE
jgi:hypothetical protein